MKKSDFLHADTNSRNLKVDWWRRSGVFIVNSEHISHLVLEFLLLTLSR